MSVTAGLPHPNATWAMPATHLVAEERTIKGSYIGTCVPSINPIRRLKYGSTS